MAFTGTILFLAAVSPAPAATPPGNPVQGVSAVDQYVEAIPTSSGPAPTGRSTKEPRPLPAAVAARVREEAGADAEALLEVATSPTFGAPGRSRRSDSRDAREAAPTEPTARAGTEPSPLDAVVSPVAEADEGRFLVLLALLGGMTMIAFATAARRQRR